MLAPGEGFGNRPSLKLQPDVRPVRTIQGVSNLTLLLPVVCKQFHQWTGDIPARVVFQLESFGPGYFHFSNQLYKSRLEPVKGAGTSLGNTFTQGSVLMVPDPH